MNTAEACFALSATQINQIKAFHDYCMYNAAAYCAICLKKLYPDQVKIWPDGAEEINFPCNEWNHPPLRQWPQNWIQTDQLCNGHVTAYQFEGVIVCSNCEKDATPPFSSLTYPGDIPPAVTALNYREKSTLSPIKLMTKMTRKTTRSGRIGHFELSGYLQLKHNYEFGSMLYGGMLGLTIRRGPPSVINMQRVQQAYQQLCQLNPLLNQYIGNMERAEDIVQYHATENRQFVRLQSTWRDNILMPIEPAAPMAAQLAINQLPIGTLDSTPITLLHPSVMALLFPWLFINGKGHYSLVSNENQVIQDNNNQIIPEERGGIATARKGRTFATYIKQQLLNVDRRFARDPSFLFWAFDVKEKANIHSANRHTVRTGGRDLTKDDLLTTEGEFDYSKVTIVPHNITSSYAYHRKHYLDLKAMCDHLGPPQLFLTFSCDDLAPSFQNATGLRETWKDPVMFALHFQRKWNKFMEIIKKQWASKVGGITDWCYVMEIQGTFVSFYNHPKATFYKIDRGSPHKHLVLWTNKTADELIKDESIACARLPPLNSPLYKLVTKHQIHKCDNKYCRYDDPSRNCRFGYPKKPSNTSYFDENDHAVYKRGITDTNINPYNPFLLACFETNMDIQINKGPAAVHYLAKYLTKLDDDTNFRLQILGTKDITIDQHMKSRIVGSIEAVYDLLSLHQHQKSREVVWLPMNLPHDQSRSIRPDLQDPSIPGSSKQIFGKTLVDHYEARTGDASVQSLLLPDFVKFYYPCTTKSEKDKYEELARQKHVAFQQEFNGELPSAIISGDKIFRLRQTKCRFWRTRLVSAMSDSETFYYQQILQYMPVYGRTFSDFKRDYMQSNVNDQHIYTWREFYLHLVQNNLLRSTIDIPDDFADYQIQAPTTPLSTSQQGIFDLITHQIEHLNNNMHWVLGGAGTGKSFLLRTLSKHYSELGYYVGRLSPTGVAAYNIQGETIDRFFGFTSERRQVNTFKLNDHAKLYKKTILLIDEFSMLDKDTLESISSAFVEVTGRNMTFGGIPVIFFGDVGQLLPPKLQQVWESSLFIQGPKYSLQQSMRQQDDPDFLRILNKVRRMDVDYDTEVVDFILSRVRPPPAGCIHLFTSNQEARYENLRQLRRLQGELQQFPAIDYPANNQAAKTTLTLDTNLPEIVFLKNDAIVMLLRNLDVSRGWNNGTLCLVKTIYIDAILVEHLETGATKLIHRVQDYVPNTIYTRRQFPLRPSYASTIHKVQSLTLPCVAINFNDMPYHGQLYVAMSRVRSAEDLYFFGINPGDIERVFRLYANCDAIQIVEDFLTENERDE